jgi:hypothetical protein
MHTTYWELSEQERAALTREDVSRYLDAELMTKGVLKVSAPAYQAEPTIPAPTATVFEAVHETGYGGPSVAFSSVEAAQAFVALGPLSVDHDYKADVDSVSPYRSLVVRTRSVYSRDQVAARAVDMSRLKEVRDDNERRRVEYEASVKAQDRALDGLWADWHACRAKAERIAKLEATRAEYRKLAGDAETAEIFLGKVFGDAARAEAAEWGQAAE